MSNEPLKLTDYPLAETRPDLVRGGRGKSMGEIELDGLLKGEVTLEDLRITGDALRQQGEIAIAAGRPTLAQNFGRAAELVGVPQEMIMRVYELLRPGRAKSRGELIAAAAELKDKYGADAMAAFVEEAADVYERRGLFSRRF